MITAWAMFSGEPKSSASPEPATGKASKVGRDRYSGPAASAVDDFHRLGRFAGPRGQAADFAAEGLPDLLRELLVGLRDFAAKLLAAAAEVARIHVLLHLLANPAADRSIFIRNDLQPACGVLGRRLPAPALRSAAEEFVDLLLDSSAVVSIGREGVRRLRHLPHLRSHHPDQRDDDEDDHDADRKQVDSSRQQNDRVHAVAPFLLFAEAGALMRAMADRMSVSACTLRNL